MKWTSWQGLALAFALVTGAGCGKGGQQASQPADTAGGDLMLARPESAAALNDVPAPGATPPAAAPTPDPTRAGRRAPAPERTAPSARQPAATGTEKE